MYSDSWELWERPNCRIGALEQWNRSHLPLASSLPTSKLPTSPQGSEPHSLDFSTLHYILTLSKTKSKCIYVFPDLPIFYFMAQPEKAVQKIWKRSQPPNRIWSGSKFPVNAIQSWYKWSVGWAKYSSSWSEKELWLFWAASVQRFSHS